VSTLDDVNELQSNSKTMNYKIIQFLFVSTKYYQVFLGITRYYQVLPHTAHPFSLRVLENTDTFGNTHSTSLSLRVLENTNTFGNTHTAHLYH